jgi:hypothetical protein
MTLPYYIGYARSRRMRPGLILPAPTKGGEAGLKISSEVSIYALHGPPSNAYDRGSLVTQSLFRAHLTFVLPVAESSSWP